MQRLTQVYTAVLYIMAGIAGATLIWLMVSVILSVVMRSRTVALLCVLVCLVLAWKGLELWLTNMERNDFDVRAYYYPRSLLTFTFPLSFGFMAVEFARFVFGSELLHSGEAGIHE